MLKNTNYHYKYIGKKYHEKIRKVEECSFQKGLIHGPFILLNSIIKEIHIEEMLREHLTEYESMQITEVFHMED